MFLELIPCTGDAYDKRLGLNVCKSTKLKSIYFEEKMPFLYLLFSSSAHLCVPSVYFKV